MEITLVLATNNEHKLQEVRKILPSNIKLLSLKEARIKAEDVEENGSTYKENSLIKAKHIAYKTNYTVIADDSGLEIKFLGKNTPGTHTKRYSESNGGQEATNVMLSEKACKTSRFLNKAKFVCCITLINYDHKIRHFTGVMKGKISTSTAGKNGFGYDPIFIPRGYKKTIAELDEEIKNTISHRYRALKKLVKFLNKSKL